MEDENEIWVIHPEHGFVKFSGMTQRQKDVLEEYAHLFSWERTLVHDEVVKDFLDEKRKESGEEKSNTQK